jgi:hypothetical protein
VFVLGHSQGALIAATWGTVPGHEAAGFVLSSPYLRLKLEPPRLKVLGARSPPISGTPTSPRTRSCSAGPPPIRSTARPRPRGGSSSRGARRPSW